MIRQSGILLPVFSLPSPWAIGDIGARARNFVDWLAAAGQNCWQMLPLTCTKEILGNSPYDSISAFACSPLLISIEDLAEEELISNKEISSLNRVSSGRVDYSAAKKIKMPLLKKAFQRFMSRTNTDPLYRFWEGQAWWLDDFSLFSAISCRLGDDRWNTWPSSLKIRDKVALDTVRTEEKDHILFTVFIQYEAFTQIQRLRKHSLDRGIQLIGDLPIYVSYESADVWSHPEMFQLDRDLTPKAVAGVPPDYFSSTGQRWGNPLYRWDYAKGMEFHWWLKRIAHSLQLYDMIRLDHFRGFLEYWAIPYTEKTAIYGRWEEGPGDSFFSALEKNFPSMPFLAENLGIITPDITRAMKKYDLPGMLVLLFAFDESMPRNPYILHNHEPRNIVYTGTHDNNTVRGWFDDEGSPQDKERVSRYMNMPFTRDNAATVLTRMALMSVAERAVIPLQDYLNIGGEGRINKPSTLEGNWQWMAEEKALTEDLASSLHSLMKTYGRL